MIAMRGADIVYAFPAVLIAIMLADSQTYLAEDAWLAVWPGLAIALAVLGFSLLGDGLRDVLDPRLRRGA